MNRCSSLGLSTCVALLLSAPCSPQNASGEKGIAANPMQETLEKKVDQIQIRGKNFYEAIDEIRKVSGINIAVDPEVMEKMLASNQKVDLVLSNVKINTVLATFFRMYNLAADLQDEVLYVTTPGKTSQGQDVVTQTYNIRPFISERPQFTLTAIPFSLEESMLLNRRIDYGFYERDDIVDYLVSGRRIGEWSQKSWEGKGYDLVDFITENIAPETWQKDGRVGILFSPDGTLTVTHTWDVHHQILALLDQLSL
ncbi:MAG: hypothetical protein HYU36_02570 [Planctomycetes bacterium]|nr:hypothetical protein [Planctomycetota bacterium]